MRKMHYYDVLNNTTSLCGVDAYSDNIRHTFISSEVTCKRCLRIIHTDKFQKYLRSKKDMNKKNDTVEEIGSKTEQLVLSKFWTVCTDSKRELFPVDSIEEAVTIILKHASGKIDKKKIYEGLEKGIVGNISRSYRLYRMIPVLVKTITTRTIVDK